MLLFNRFPRTETNRLTASEEVTGRRGPEPPKAHWGPRESEGLLTSCVFYFLDPFEFCVSSVASSLIGEYQFSWPLLFYPSKAQTVIRNAYHLVGLPFGLKIGA